MDYFKTITMGLTATPTDIIDHNTFQLFHCEDGLPTFAYTFEEAVNNVPPYLCSFLVMKIQTRFQMEGISKRTISLEDQKKLMLEGKEIEEINFEGSQLEKQVINKGTNTLIVREFMEECIKDGSGVLDERYKAKCCESDAKDWLEQVRILRDTHGIAPEASLVTFQQQTAKAPVANSNFLKSDFLEGCRRTGLFETWQ